MSRLPVTEEFIESQDYGDQPELFAVFNVMPDFREFLHVADQAFSIERIVAIPDTLERRTADAIEQEFDLRVSRCDSVEEVHRSVRDYITRRESDRPMYVLDIGGHCCTPLSEIRDDSIVGVVEDTNFGHWKYTDTDLDYPVVSIAQSPIKSIENRVIGDAVVFSLENVLRNDFERELFGTDVLVLGYGNIGRSVASALEQRRATVHVYDVDPVKTASALVEGYTVGRRDELLRDCEIVIGATGQTSVRYSDVSSLPRDCIVASATSGTVEIEIDRIRDNMSRVATGDHWDRFRSDDSEIVVLDNGEPINFLDNSVSYRILDAIYPSLLAGCSQLLSDDLECEVHDISHRREKDVAEAWVRQYR